MGRSSGSELEAGGEAAATAVQTQAALDAALARLPRFPGMKDLLDAFGGREPLVDAYVQGQLPLNVEEVLEADFPRLSCWLLARILRTQHEAAG